MVNLREYIYNLYEGYGYRMLLGYIFSEASATIGEDVEEYIEPTDIKLDLDVEYFIKIQEDVGISANLERTFGSITRVMNGVWIEEQSDEFLDLLEVELEEIFESIVG